MMSRRRGETILIGDDIEIVIAHIGRTRVKVAIRAPRETLIVASEVRLIRDENLRAATATASDLKNLIARLRSSV
jgi:carbon storage regulator